MTSGVTSTAAHRIEWLAAGTQRLEALCAGLDGAWHNRRHRHDLVGAALEALHLLQRDHHYLVRDGRIELLDAQTGRAAPGRVWSRGLQTLVELKEGCTPSPATTPRAQISYPRFFARYLRLCGMSGTLAECAPELRALYRRPVVVIALRKASMRTRWADRWFMTAAHRHAAVVQRAIALHRQGRPVLIGTDSVADSELLSQRLAAAGVAHRVLNARHDAAEAEIVAQAGQRGAVTVATQMAGRGTDIVLGPGVAGLGGLHVLGCQDGTNSRLQRQLIGRCGRQGDPGSAEVWRHLEAPCWSGGLGSGLRRIGRKADELGVSGLPGALLRAWMAWLGKRDERRNARQRRQLLELDRQWQSRLNFSTLNT